MCVCSALFVSWSTCSLSPVSKVCLCESIASAFLSSNWGSLACTREYKEQISVLIWQSGKQQYATVQNWIKFLICTSFAKWVEGGLANIHVVKGKESNTVPVLYQSLIQSQHFLVSADLPRFPQQDRVANSLLGPRVIGIEHLPGLKQVQWLQNWPPQKFTLNFETVIGVQIYRYYREA